MSKLTITVLKNPLVTDFIVTVTNASSQDLAVTQAQFKKVAAGQYTFLKADFSAGASLPAKLTIFGGGAGSGRPLAWAEFNLDGSDLEPQLAVQIDPGQNTNTASYTYPVSAAAKKALHPKQKKRP
jgi:hypothetical protein